MISLMHGDCLELMKDIPDGSVDLILCDLPYGTTACKWDVVIPFDKLWNQYWRVLKPNGAVVLFGTQPFTSILGSSQSLHLKYSWVWEKTKPTNFVHAKRMPLRGFEDILVFYRKPPTYVPQGLLRVDRKVKNTGTKGRKGVKENGDQSFMNHIVNSKDTGNNSYTQEFTNYPRGIILEGVNGGSDSLHPTQKPVKLLEYLIKTYTNVGETVLDNCMGSGSTGVACVNTKRNFIGIEKDATYYGIATARIDDALNTVTKTIGEAS